MILKQESNSQLDKMSNLFNLNFNSCAIISPTSLSIYLILLLTNNLTSFSQILAHQQAKQAGKLIINPFSNNATASKSIDFDRFKNSTNQQRSSDNNDLENPTDWLMMDGQADLAWEEGKSVASFAELSGTEPGKRSKKAKKGPKSSNGTSSKTSFNFDDDSQAESSDSNESLDDADEGTSLAGSQKEPDCAAHGRYYCTYKEDYPLKLVTEVTKYYKWPLEKLFRDLHAQIMPKLAQDKTGNLVCDSITRVVRPGWARNTNERWLVVINTENYHQYVTEVVCQYGSNSRCNFIPPCYYSSCQQRYNTQKLLVIDPNNPYRGPFLSEFLFPSCCVCYVPSSSDSFQDKFRSSPATIYQRTLQQESANNLYPPQFKPAGLIDDKDIAASLMLPSSQKTGKEGENQAAGPGEIRRRGEFQHSNSKNNRETATAGAATTTTNAQNGKRASELGATFPRLGLADSLLNNDNYNSGNGANNLQQ